MSIFLERLFLLFLENINCSVESEKSASSVDRCSVSLPCITDYINFIERTKIGRDTILAPMDVHVSNFYTNIYHKMKDENQSAKRTISSQ